MNNLIDLKYKVEQINEHLSKERATLRKLFSATFSPNKYLIYRNIEGGPLCILTNYVSTVDVETMMLTEIKGIAIEIGKKWHKIGERTIKFNSTADIPQIMFISKRELKALLKVIEE